jgi:hypothetical protein
MIHADLKPLPGDIVIVGRIILWKQETPCYALYVRRTNRTAMLRLTNGDYEYRLGWHGGREPEEYMAVIPDCLVPKELLEKFVAIRILQRCPQQRRAGLSSQDALDHLLRFQMNGGF